MFLRRVLLRPEIIRNIDLPRHGLEILPLDGTFTPMPSGDYLWRVNDHGKTRREIARHSKLDAEAYEEFGKAMQAMCRFVKPILSMVPPDPATLNPKELMKLLFLGRRFQGLSGEDKYNQVQLMTMSAVDFLDQWFETDVLKATMSASGIIGTFLGVRSPGTAYELLHHYMGEIDGAFRAWGFARGGTGAISNAIADAAREAGVEIRTRSGISKILVKGGKAKGVVLQNGDEVFADVISSSVDPRLTFLGLIEAGNLPDEFVESVKRYKFRGSSGKVNMALDGLPNFKCLPGVGAHLRGAMSISPSVEYMEKAYDEAKYGHWSSRPYIDMVLPSLTDPSVAPPGKHVMSCFVQYAPYKLAPGLDWDTEKEKFGDAVVNTIAEYAPNIKDIILHRQVADTSRPRTRIRTERRKHLPRRVVARAIVLPAPGCRLGAISNTDQKSLHVWISNPSWRRHHGRERASGGSRNSERREGSGLTHARDTRRRHHRWRTQRTRHGFLPREGGLQTAGTRTTSASWWRRRHRGISSRISWPRLVAQRRAACVPMSSATCSSKQHGLEIYNARSGRRRPLAPDGRALILYPTIPKKQSKEVCERSPERCRRDLVDFQGSDRQDRQSDWGKLFQSTPPNIDNPSTGDLWGMLQTGRGIRNLGTQRHVPRFALGPDGGCRPGF